MTPIETRPKWTPTTAEDAREYFIALDTLIDAHPSAIALRMSYETRRVFEQNLRSLGGLKTYSGLSATLADLSFGTILTDDVAESDWV